MAERIKRYVVSGAPGCGKTSVLEELARRGYAVVPEAATEVIARAQARGLAEPWSEPEFVEQVLRLQQQRQREADASGATVQLHDRSPVCTLALADYLARPVPDALTTEVHRVVRERVYERQVIFLRPIGFVRPTAARRITYQASLDFERVHRRLYRAHGYELVDIGRAPVADRAAQVDAYLRSWALARSG